MASAGGVASASGERAARANCFATRRPKTAKKGRAAILTATIVNNNSASCRVRRLKLKESAITINANSPPGARRNAVSSDAAVLMRKKRARTNAITALTKRSAQRPAKMRSGLRQIAPGSILIPTEKKNTPSRSDLNGSIATSIARRYSVSAKTSPATKAPSAIERPAKALATPVPTATKIVAAIKNSGLSGAATRRNNGFNKTRLTITIPTIASAPSPKANKSASHNGP